MGILDPPLRRGFRALGGRQQVGLLRSASTSTSPAARQNPSTYCARGAWRATQLAMAVGDGGQSAYVAGQLDGTIDLGTAGQLVSEAEDLFVAHIVRP